MRRYLPLAALLLLGCAAQPPGASSPAERQTVVVSTDMGNIEIERFTDTRGTNHRIPAATDAVWHVLVDAYGEMQIALGTVDRPNGTLGNTRLIATRTLAGQRLSRFFSCGSTATGSPVADSYRMEISVLTTVREDAPDTSLLQTQLRATGYPHGPSSSPVQCASTGNFEERLARMVLLLLLQG
jgi:hypothetical protein